MKKTYMQPASCVVKLLLHDATNQNVPIFGEGSRGGGPGIADGKEEEWDDDDWDTDLLRYVSPEKWDTMDADDEEE